MREDRPVGFADCPRRWEVYPACPGIDLLLVRNPLPPTVYQHTGINFLNTDEKEAGFLILPRIRLDVFEFP